MAKTLDDIQSAIAAYADEDPVAANIDSDDYALRLNFINQALQEWQESKDWQALYKEYNVTLPTGVANASVALPADFRKPASFPVITSGGSTDLYPETKPQAAGQYPNTTKRVEFLGNPNYGYTMVVYGTSLSSGASIKIPYYAQATSLASPANISVIPDTNYLVKRALAYVLEARGDSIFVEVKSEADRILGNMIDRENVLSVANDEHRVKTSSELKHRRMGGW